jgi:hypothetical protein
MGGFVPVGYVKRDRSLAIDEQGTAYSRGKLYKLLSNPTYIGEIRHLNARHAGLHEAIIDRELWAKLNNFWPSTRSVPSMDPESWLPVRSPAS